MKKSRDKNSIVYNNITDKLDEYNDEIDLFIEKLGHEKKYFDITTKRIMQSVIVFLAIYNNETIGIAGIERKYGMLRNYVTIIKEYQKGGLGPRFTLHMLEEAKKTCNIILAIVEENNYGALKGGAAIGFKKVGQRENLCYILKPLNKKGVFLFFLIKLLFPAVKLVDIFRR